MKKTMILIAAVVALLPALAQEPGGDLNRQMDVTRDYEPSVSEASKQSIKPNMVDTVALRPEVTYGIKPKPISYGFEVTPIKPVSVNLDSYRQDRPLYLKVGVGVPFQSVLDANFSSTQNTNGKWGIYANHYGSWSDIKNNNGLKTPASQTFNTVGVFGEHRFGRFGIGGEIGYDYDKVSRYGYDTSMMQILGGDYDPMDVSASALRQNFSTIRGKLNLGHSFEDLSRFNIRFGVDAAYFQDYFDMKQTDVKTYLDMGKRFGQRHEVTLHVGYDLYKGSGKLSLYKDNILSLSPMYRLRGGKFELGVGGTFVMDDSGERSENAFFPLLEAQWHVSDGFVPYLKVEGEYVNNGYRNSVARNPYLYEGDYGENTAEYNGRLGVKGGISSSFSYNVFGGVSRYRNMDYSQNLYEVNSSRVLYQGNVFVLHHRDVTMWTVGAELEGRISGAFGLEFAFQYKGYQVKEVEGMPDEVHLGLPNLTGRLDLKYNYRDKLLLKAGVDVIGPRDFDFVGLVNGVPDVVLSAYYQHVNMQFDVHLGAEYNISKTIGVFLEARNLANQKLYHYNLYRALGVNLLAGVKLQF